MNNNEFRVICTKGNENRWAKEEVYEYINGIIKDNENRWVKGEIYESKNGIIKDSRETKWGSFQDLNDFKEWIESNFTDVYFKEFKFNIGDKAIKRENNEEVVIYGYIIDEANNLEYIISNNKSKDTLRQKMDRYPKAIVGEEYMDKTCSFIYPSDLVKINKPLEEEQIIKQARTEEQIIEEFFKIREKKIEEVKKLSAINKDIDNAIRELEEQKKENNNKIEKMKIDFLF